MTILPRPADHDMLTTTILEPAVADAWVERWMAAWNSHDALAVVEHYHPDVEYFSPFVAQLADPSGRLAGRAALLAYIENALARYPDAHFDPPSLVAVGVGSVTFAYRSVGGRHALETLLLDAEGRVVRAHCHYRDAT
jgi:hypothetical protein